MEPLIGIYNDNRILKKLRLQIAQVDFTSIAKLLVYASMISNEMFCMICRKSVFMVEPLHVRQTSV